MTPEHEQPTTDDTTSDDTDQIIDESGFGGGAGTETQPGDAPGMRVMDEDRPSGENGT